MRTTIDASLFYYGSVIHLRSGQAGEDVLAVIAVLDQTSACRVVGFHLFTGALIQYRTIAVIASHLEVRILAPCLTL